MYETGNDTIKAEILEHTPAIIVFLDAKQNIVWANKAYRQATGLTLEEIKRKKNWFAAGFNKISRNYSVVKEIDTVGSAEAELLHDNQYHSNETKSSWLSREVPLKDTDGQLIGIIENVIKIADLNQSKEALSGHESFLRKVFDGIQDGICVIDPDFNVIQVNKWIERAYSDAIPLVGKKCYEAFQKRKTPCRLCPSAKTLSTGKVHMQEIQAEFAGETVFCELYTYPLRDENRNIIGIIQHIKDVTERKKVERSLRESEGKLSAMLESLGDHVSMMDKDLNILWANDVAKGLFGKDIVGKKCYQVYHGRNQPCEPYPCLTLKTFEDGQVHKHETLVQTRDGRILVYACTASVALRDSKGNPTAVIEISRDISESKMTQERLKENEEKYKNLINTSPDAIALIDEKGTFLTVNPAMARRFGLTQDELEGKMICDVIQQSLADMEIKKGKEAIEKEELVYFENEISGRKLKNYYVPVSTSNKHKTFQVISRDITEIKQTQNYLKQALNKLNHTVEGAIRTLSTTLEKRDPYTAGHQERVTKLACAIAREMGMDEDRLQGLYFAGMVHDIGKISIPAEILAKPTDLSDKESGLIKEHSQEGYDILKDIEFPWPIADIVLQHHERIDGSGYPQGLTGEQMLLEAKILAVADVVEAMSSHRPYRPGLGIDVALQEIERNKGLLYDEDVTEVCLKLFREKRYTFVE